MTAKKLLLPFSENARSLQGYLTRIPSFKPSFILEKWSLHCLHMWAVRRQHLSVSLTSCQGCKWRQTQVEAAWLIPACILTRLLPVP
jgi:hypothetical protein